MSTPNDMAIAKAHQAVASHTQTALRQFGGEAIPSFLGALFNAREFTTEDGVKKSKVGNIDITADLEAFEKGPMARANAQAAWFRANPRAKKFPKITEVMDKGALAKSVLDVGTLTNFAQITGGETLGYVSLDTQMARGTIRPNSFTLYQALNKTRANQVVDYWPYASETGGALPGSSFASYTSVQSGSLTPNSGLYNLNNVTLKLAYDARAITMALAAQNSFVDVAEQENVNAALAVLSTIDWACYGGNPNIWPNQFMGLKQSILANAPSSNVIDFQQFYNNVGSVKGWSNEQTLFNLIYEQAATITNYRNYGVITHAFMDPLTSASLQTLVTTLLNNITNGKGFTDHSGLIVNGDLQGVNTRFGDIHFPVDLLIGAREIPAAGITYSDGSHPTTSSVSAPTSVVVTVSGATNNASDWTAAYVSGGAHYQYAVAGTDANMNEGNLTWGSASGATANTAYVVTITPADSTAAAFRVYRSGLGASTSGTNATLVRHVGDVVANGSSPVTFFDLNTKIPGSSTIFLLDMDEADNAIDYRYLLPLSKINLFANSLFMPWAVAHIGALRLRIPKWHGFISNYIPTNPTFNPLASNGL